MNIRSIITSVAALCLLVSCQKDANPGYSQFNDAEYLQDGLVRQDRLSADYHAVDGTLKGDVVTIFVSSYQEAETHFLGLAPKGARVEKGTNRWTWSLTDGEGKAQGEAVFAPGDGQRQLATLELPSACTLVRKVVYESVNYRPFQAVNPDVQEMLNDYYYYGAIVSISDHGCGSGKFVVFRQYNFDNGTAGMAVRMDSRHWDLSEMKIGDNSSKVFGRASCLNTMRQAGAIYRNDKDRLSKQLKNAGCTALDQHYASSDETWNGWHYYYCLHDDDCDWIGPVNDTDFYECWIYFFVPEGDHLHFW